MALIIFIISGTALAVQAYRSRTLREIIKVLSLLIAAVAFILSGFVLLLP